jgi:hypothetical protein
LKTARAAKPSGVRIPLPPPHSGDGQGFSLQRWDRGSAPRRTSRSGMSACPQGSPPAARPGGPPKRLGAGSNRLRKGREPLVDSHILPCKTRLRIRLRHGRGRTGRYGHEGEA